MPRNKNKKKPSPKRKPKRKGGAARGAPALSQGAKGSLIRSHLNPGTNYSQIVRTGTYVSFEGSTSEYMQLTGRQKLCTVSLFHDSGIDQLYAGFGVYNNGAPGSHRSQIYVKPSNSFFFPPPLTIYGQVAQYYQVVDMVFEYVTNTGTNKSTAFTLAFTPDVAYCEGRGYGSATTLLLLPDVETLTSAVKVPAYAESATLVATPMTGWLYTYDDAKNSGDFSFGNTAEDRLSWAGALLIAANSFETTVEDEWVDVGDIFVTYRVRYKGLILPQDTSISSLKSRALPDGKALRLSKELAVVDDVSKSFTPSPKKEVVVEEEKSKVTVTLPRPKSGR